jgi:hypothetical protein
MLAISVSQHTLEMLTVYDYAASQISFSSNSLFMHTLAR